MEFYNSACVWASAHPFVLSGLTMAAAHWKLVIKGLFKIKILRALAVGNPQEAHAWIADLKTEVDADIDEAVKDAAAHAPTKQS